MVYLKNQEETFFSLNENRAGSGTPLA
jgi:hypothetical protein